MKTQGMSVGRWCAAFVLAGITLTSCGSPAPGPPPRTSVPASSPSPVTVAVDVYYVVDTPGGLRLVGERRDVPRSAAAESAIAAMISGPDDPAYSTTWNPKTRVIAVSRRGDQVTVDLSADARRANVGSAGAALMVQQLVYTVTSATRPTDRVRLLIEGEPAGELWGVLAWDEAVGRDSTVLER